MHYLNKKHLKEYGFNRVTKDGTVNFFFPVLLIILGLRSFSHITDFA